MKILLKELAGKPMYVYSGTPPPHIEGLTPEQERAHHELHQSGQLLAVLVQEPGEGYEGVVCRTGKATYFRIDDVLEGTIGKSGADVNLSDNNLIAGCRLRIYVNIT